MPAKNKNKGLVVWLTGLPCSGKTTLSLELEKRLIRKNFPVKVLDGDIIRKTISRDLGFLKEDRIENIRRAAIMAKNYSEKGINIIAAFVSPYRESRDYVRSQCANFVEVYLKCDVEECKKRDTKGLYKMAEKGQIKCFTGVQDPYEEPDNPEIMLETDKLDVRESADVVEEYIRKKLRGGWASVQKRAPVRSAFVVGCGHSGTSLMLRILGEHSRIYPIPGETRLFLDYGKEQIENQLKKFDRLTVKSGKEIWVEKTPKHIGKIKKIFSYRPEARVIAMVRDPRDVACSMKARGFSFKQGLERWIKDNLFLIEHKDRTGIMAVKLESLVKKPDMWIKKVLDYLQLPYENLAGYHRKKKDWFAGEVVVKKPLDAKGGNHEKMRNWQINQPIFPDTARYFSDMNREDKQIFQKNIEALKHIARQLAYVIE